MYMNKTFITDLELGLTYAGTMQSYEVINDKVKVTLIDVLVYDYYSSHPLYNLNNININKSKKLLYQE